jgi:hypothetical protein
LPPPMGRAGLEFRDVRTGAAIFAERRMRAGVDAIFFVISAL